jgi:5-methylcytosine-specific restriction endonuclease McrA
MKLTDLVDVSDAQVLAEAPAIHLDGRRNLAHLIALLAIIHERRLYAKAACSSTFIYCNERLGMPRATAWRHANAAELVCRFPSLLASIASCDITLTALRMIGPHLSPENFEAVMAEALGKKEEEIEKIAVRISGVRLPRPGEATERGEIRLVGAKTESLELPVSPSTDASSASAARATDAPDAPNTPPPGPHLEYELRVRHDEELRQLLVRATQLLGHVNRSGAIALTLKIALREAIEKREKKRRKSDRPRIRTKPTKPGYITDETRREVFERDGDQCTYCDDHGNRCTERTGLELDHVIARAHQGSDGPENLRVRCRPHNDDAARAAFGDDKIDAEIAARRARTRARADARRGMSARSTAQHQPTTDTDPTAARELQMIQKADAPAPREPEKTEKPENTDTTATREKSDATTATLSSALIGLGFLAKEARAVAQSVVAKHASNGPPSMAQLIREALAQLT